jgi:hypothetical protein
VFKMMGTSVVIFGEYHDHTVNNVWYSRDHRYLVFDCLELDTNQE